MARKAPTLKEHPRSGSSYAYFNGKQVWFGTFKDPATKREFARFVLNWEDNGRQLRDESKDAADEPVIDDLIARFIEHGEKHYRRKDRTPTGELDNVVIALRALSKYRVLRVSDFDLSKLEAVRSIMIGDGLARSTINARVWRIVRVFKWGAKRGLVPAKVLGSLVSVEPLEEGRSDAKETDPVRPIAWDQVEAVLPYLPAPGVGLVLLQWHTGMRPGEAVQLRPADLNRDRKTWLYTPRFHKTDRTKAKVIPIGPEARAVLEPLLLRVPQPATDAPVFSPADSLAERHAHEREQRKTPLWPSQEVWHELRRVARVKAREERSAAHERGEDVPKPRALPGSGYSVASYRQMIERGIAALRKARKLAGDKTPVESWGPNRLRHSYATRIAAAAKNMNAARVVLGHTNLSTTAIYAERDLTEAIQVAELYG